MRHPGAHNPSLSRGWVILCLLLALLAPLALSADRGRSRSERYKLAQDDFERAKRLQADLDGTPRDQRAEKEYLRAIYFYRRVYDQAPFSSLAADALDAAAEIYHDMGKQFDPKYWDKAIEAYQFLLQQYPHSRYQDDARFNIAQIYHVHLKDTDKALDLYQDFLKRYPKSRYAATVRERIRSIQADQAAAREAKAKQATTEAATDSGGRVEVRNIRYWNTENYTRVVVDLEGQVKYQEARIANPDRIFFDLFNTRLSTVLEGKSFSVDQGLLDRIRVAENREGVTRVVLEVKGADDYSVFTLPNPFRIVVDIHGPQPAATAKKAPEKAPSTQTAKSTPPAESAPPTKEQTEASLPRPPPVPKPTTTGDHTLTRALGLKVGRIVIDPGHGGHDTGTIGPTGLMEKDLVLDVARRLGKLLEDQLGAEVIYTRDDDTFVPLENRIALANEKQADLFISIHANSSRHRDVRGVETFYLNFTSDPEALELAARENALSQKSVHELQDLVRQISRNDKVAESRELATALQSDLYGALSKDGPVRNRGVKSAPFVVLIGGNMPSVLTEIGFISNPSEEKLMKSSDGRQSVAQALYDGTTRYLESVNSLAFAGSANKTAANQE